MIAMNDLQSNSSFQVPKMTTLKMENYLLVMNSITRFKRSCLFLVWKRGGFIVFRPDMPLMIVSLKGYVIIKEKIIRKLEAFFHFVILPELASKYFTSNQNVLKNLPKNLPNIICFCQKPQFGRLIICAKSTCLIKVFYFPLVGVRRFCRKWCCSYCDSRSKK